MDRDPPTSSAPVRLPRWRELVIVGAGTSWDGIPMPERHVAVHLSRTIPVLWVDPAIGCLAPLRSGAQLPDPRLRMVAPGVLRLTPVTVPGTTRRGLRDIATAQVRRAVRRAVARIGAEVRCTLVAGTEDLLDAVPTRQRLFYGTDDFVAGAGLLGTDAAWLARRQRRQLELADTVVAISPFLRDAWATGRPDVVMIPNGCEAEHYAAVDSLPRPDDIGLPDPIAGFVGHLSERIDLAMLEAVAATGASLLLVGPRQSTFELARMDALLARPNVRWVGPKAFAELPAYLGAIHVGLTPYAQSDFNRASFPLKTLEYLAAGRPAVVSDLPAHRWLDTRHVRVTATPGSFAARVGELLAASMNPTEAAERRAFAARHSWSARAAEIAALIGLEPARSADAA